MNKKGFTLIELLAVIVILAIIALIATPLVLKYIEKSRQESKVDSAYSFVRNLETEIANYSIKNNGKKYNKSGLVEIGDLTEIDTTVKGDNPDTIKVCLSSLGQVEKAMFEYGKYYVSYDGKKGSISDKDTYDNFSCSGNGSNEVITEEAGLYDADGKLLYSWNELVNTYGIDVEKDYKDEDDCDVVDRTMFPSSIFSSNSDLNKGVKLVIDGSVTKIGMGAFDSTTLSTIIIPGSVVSIGDFAFQYSKLVDITLSNGITNIGAYAFYENELTSLRLPKTVISIGKKAFTDSFKLAEIVVDEENSVYDSRNNSNAIIETTTNKLLYGSKNTIIPTDIISIGEWAFSSTEIENITIPNSVTNIGQGAFYGCEKLTNVVLSNKLEKIENDMFKYSSNLTVITIPKSVTSIGSSVFYGCGNLKEINYEGTESEWNSIQIDTFVGLSNNVTINYNQAIN